MKTISSFTGEYEFLSNFYAVEFVYDGISYPTSEHAFHAQKTSDTKIKKFIASLSTPGQAKKHGRKIDMRKDWDSVRVGIMEDVLRAKFSSDDMKELLLATGDAELIEGNTWNDRFWGVCKGNGQNNLGKLLMKIRADLNEEENLLRY